MRETNKGVIWKCKVLLPGSPRVIPLSPQRQITPSAKLGDFYFQFAESDLAE
jgi:hypothetical protein